MLMLSGPARCPICAERQPRQLPQMAGGLWRGDTPLTWWQIDYIRPLPMSEGAQYALTCMYTTMRIMQAYLSKMANQQATVCGLKQDVLSMYFQK